MKRFIARALLMAGAVALSACSRSGTFARGPAGPAGPTGPTGATGGSGSSGSGSGVPNIVVFNQSDTWQVPTGVNRIIVEAWGGGAGGTGIPFIGSIDSGGVCGGAGGGGGGYGKGGFSVSPGVTYTITIGAGGQGVAGDSGQSGNNPLTGNPGDTTSMTAMGSDTALISATGGQTSAEDQNLGSWPGGAGGTSTAPISVNGQAGQATYSVESDANGGNGGSAGGGGGPGGIGAFAQGAYNDGTVVDAPGGDGVAPGGGGGGVGALSSAAALGGNGAPGRIIIYY